jgi:membrane-associated phospholipid phosphatase
MTTRKDLLLTIKNPHNQLLFLVLFFASLGAYLLSQGQFMFVSKSIILPCLIAFSTVNRQAKDFFRDWAVFIAVLIAFDVGRGFIFRLLLTYHIPIHNDYVITFEHLFVNSSLSNLFQTLLLPPNGYPFLAKLLVFVYCSHFVYFLLIGFLIWRLKFNSFWQFKRAYIACMLLGLLCYLLIPTTPPWLAAQQGFIAPVIKLYSHYLNTSLPSLLPIFDLNPVAAMPSIHVAFPTLAALILSYHFGVKAWPTYIYTLLVCLSCIGVGAHYLLDIIAGMALASLCFIIFYRLPTQCPLPPRSESIYLDFFNAVLTAFVILSILMCLNISLLSSVALK